MKKFSIYPGIILSICTLFVSSFFAEKVIRNASFYKVEKTKIAEILDFNDRLLNITEAIPMVGDLLWNTKAAKYAELLTNAENHYQEALYFGWIFSGIILFACLLFYLIYHRTNKWFGLSFGLLTAALAFLVLGLFSPVLELEAYKDNLSIRLEVDALELMSTAEGIEQNALVQSLGLDTYVAEGIMQLKKWIPSSSINFEKVYADRMYFFYQNKGIFDLVETLWKKGNIPIALIIAAFSMVVPFIKLCASFIFLFYSVKKNARFRKVLAYFTKFSMLDVFVAATFVSYFSFSEINVGVETESRVLVGLYFFSIYVLLAIFSGLSLNKFIKNSNKKVQV